MIKILYLFEHLNLGGAEQLLFTTLKYLNRDKFLPVVYCLGEKGKIGEAIEGIGIKVESLNRKVNICNPAIIHDLVHILNKERPNILHTNLFFANVYGRLSSKLAAVKTIVTTLHNPDYTYEDSGRWTFKIRKLLDRYSAKLTNTNFIAVSELVKEDFEKQLKFKNIKVLPNCIEVSRFVRLDASIIKEKRKELGINDDDFIILNVGRIHPQKGQTHLIEAFNLVQKDNPQAKLIIAGIFGNDINRKEAQLKNRIATLGLSANVIFLKDRRDIPEIMNASDIFAFPSLYEGFGIAMIEAMASGLPVVASDIIPLNKIIRNNIDGILVEKQNYKILADKISELIKDKARRAYLGRNARERAMEFDVKKYVINLENIYQGLSYGTKDEGMPCLVCRGHVFKNTIYGGYFYKNKAYSIVKCQNCGFMFLNPLPDKEVLSDIYHNDAYFDTYYVTAAGEKSYIDVMHDYSGADQELLSLIKRYKKSGRLLDVGCGGGRFLTSAREAGFEVCGIEPNPKMAEYARVNLSLDVRQGMLEDVVCDGPFDIIYAGDVLEHMLYLEKNIQILRTLLTDDGILIINQPLQYNRSLFNLFLEINMLLKKNRYSINPPTHLWEFNPGTLRKFLQNYNLRIIYLKTQEAKAKPLSINNSTVRNIFGYHIKNFSSIISNSPLLKGLNIGDRGIIVCKKNNQGNYQHCSNR